MVDEELFKTIAGAGRGALRAVWARREERDTMPPAEREILHLLETHKEYRAYWEGAEPSEFENPFLHVNLHQVLDRQLALGEPPALRDALARLVAGGLDRHEACHRLMQVLVLELAEMMRGRAPFDATRFAEKLDEIVP